MKNSVPFISAPIYFLSELRNKIYLCFSETQVPGKALNSFKIWAVFLSQLNCQNFSIAMSFILKSMFKAVTKREDFIVLLAWKYIVTNVDLENM